MVCHGAPVTSLLLGLHLEQLAEPPAAPSSPVLPSQCCQVVAVTSHPKAAVNSPELLLQREVTQRQSREPGPPCVWLDPLILLTQVSLGELVCLKPSFTSVLEELPSNGGLTKCLIY